MATQAFGKRVTVAAGAIHYFRLPREFENAIPRDIIVEAIPLAGATAEVAASAAPEADIDAWIAAEAASPGTGPATRPNVAWVDWSAGPIVNPAVGQEPYLLTTYFRFKSTGGVSEFNVRQF